MTRFKPGDLVVYRMQKSSVHPGFPRPFGIEQTLLSSSRLSCECTTQRGEGGCESVSDSQQTSTCPQ